MIIKDKDISMLTRPGEVFGDHFALTEEKIKRSFTLCRTQVKCLFITFDNLTAFMKKLYSSPEYQEKYNFLLSAIPFMNKVTRITRDRITKAFRTVSHPPGHVLFREGEFIKSAYIVVKGEVELTSTKNFQFIQMIQDLEL
jgi:hypothetical protein